MSRFRKIDPRIWADEKFRRLSQADMLIALHCLTSTQTNRIGIFYLSPGLAMEQLGMKAEGYAKGIRRVCDTLGWGIDEDVNVLYMPTWWKYNGGIGHLTIRGWLDDVHEVPQTPLLQEFMANTRYLSDRESGELDTLAKGMPRVCQGYLPKSAQETETETETEQETETETETKKKPPKTADAPVPPELDTPEFQEAWAEWLAYRKEKREKFTPRSQKMALKELATMGPKRAIAAIERSIAKGWKGIYEEKPDGTPKDTGRRNGCVPSEPIADRTWKPPDPTEGAGNTGNAWVEADDGDG